MIFAERKVEIGNRRLNVFELSTTMWQQIAFAGTLAIALFIPLLWPGDAPFINDEAGLFLSAYCANQHHTLAKVGLLGNVGLPYGPLPTWIYQIILTVTTVPSLWVLIRSFFTITAIAAGLLLLARATGLWKWLVPIAFFSPYIWIYSRHLWDNSLLLPFSALAIGAYAYYLSSKSPTAFLLAFVTSLLLPLIHFMAVPLTAAMLLHMGLFAWKQTWKVRALAAGIVGLVFVSHAGYFTHLWTGISHLHRQRVWESADYVRGWVFPLLGGQSLSGRGLGYFFGFDWLPHHPLFTLLKGISCLAYLFVFMGMYLAGRMIWKSQIWVSLFRDDRTEPVRVDTRTHLSLIALTALSLHIVLCGLSHSFGQPHYYNGTWIVYLFLAWIAIDKIVTKNWGLALVSAYGASLAALLIVIVVLVHERGGTRGIYYGPTINNQLEIARDIGSKNRDDLSCSVNNFIRFPSLSALRVLCLNGGPGRKQGPLIIEFARDDTRSGLVRTRVRSTPFLGPKSGLYKVGDCP